MPGGWNSGVVDSVSLDLPASSSGNSYLVIRFQDSAAGGSTGFSFDAGLEQANEAHTVKLEGAYTPRDYGGSSSSSRSGGSGRGGSSSGLGTILSSAPEKSGTVLTPNGATPGMTTPGNVNKIPGTGR